MDTRINPFVTRVRTSLDVIVFFLSFIIGIIAILVSKSYDAPIIITLLLPIVIIMGYAIIAYLYSSNALEPDIIGDNCYYLGFIFTLVSLAHTLYAVSGSQTNPETVHDIISGFGIALSSTIAGIFARAFFLQYRPDIVTAERKARQEILQATREFRTELHQSVGELKYFSRAVQQRLGEHEEALKRASEESMQKHRDWLSQLSVDTAQEAINMYKLSMAQLIDVMNLSAKEYAKVLEQKLQSDNQIVIDWISEAGSEIVSIGNSIRAQMEQINGSVDTASVSTRHLAEQLDKAAQGLVEAAKYLDEQFIRVTHEISHHIATAGGSLADVAQQSIGKIRESSERYAGVVNEEAAVIAESSSLRIDTLKESISELQHAKEVLNNITPLLVSIPDRVTAVNSVLDKLESKATKLDEVLTMEKPDNAPGTTDSMGMVALQDPGSMNQSTPAIHEVEGKSVERGLRNLFGFGKK